jgi:hypothetical protein
MKKLLTVLAITLTTGLFIPEAQAKDRHHRHRDRDCDSRSYSVRTRVYRNYYYDDYRYRPQVRYYRPAYYDCRPRYYAPPRVSFFFGF